MSDALMKEMARMRAERAAKAAASTAKYVPKGAIKRASDAEGEGMSGKRARESEDEAHGRDAPAGTSRESARTAFAAHVRVLEDEEEDAKMDALSVEETIRRLRTLGQPATMFGEMREDGGEGF